MIIYLIFIWYYKNKISIKDFDCKNIILFYFVYTIFEYTRGFFNIDGWRDYIYLYNGLFHLIIFHSGYYWQDPNISWFYGNHS